MSQSQEDASSEDEWEDVDDHPLPKQEDIQVELEVPDIVKKKKKKVTEQEMIETAMRRAANKFNKETQISTHKVHLLGLLSNGMGINNFCNRMDVKAIAFSLLPANILNAVSLKVDASILKSIHDIVSQTFQISTPLAKHGIARFFILKEKILKCFDTKIIKYKLDLVLVYIALLRSLGIKTRLVMSLQPLPFKVQTEKQQEKFKKQAESKPKKRKSSIPQLDGHTDSPAHRVTRSRTKKAALEKQDLNVHAKKPAMKRQVKNECDKENEKFGNTLPKVVKKIKSEEKQKQTKENKKVVKSAQKVKSENVDETPLQMPKVSNTKRNTRARRALPLRKEIKSDDELVSSEKSSDDEFIPKKKRVSNTSIPLTETKSKYFKTENKNVKVVKRSTTKTTSKDEIFNEWVEIYLETDMKWVSFDPFHNVVDSPEQVEDYVTSPMHYVIALDNDGSVKDVTARYASNWLTSTRRLRIGWVDETWWKETLNPYATKNKMIDQEENRQLHEYLMSLPLPKTISAFKNHPLFALRRHILKYEAIYPHDIATVGYIRGEEIFPRSAVHVLHTKDKWLQHARSVKPGEEPYKMVASLWRNMKLKQDNATLSLPLFGRWQTVPYEPAVASGGKVPRNDFGNVDLFQPEMLPIGCVHLRISNLSRVAKKLGIDAAPAIVGFDSGSGYPFPVNDGFVICEEFKETLLAAWKEDQLITAQRKQERREERIYGNWKRIIKIAMMREKIKKKYKLNDNLNDNKKEKKSGKVSTKSEMAWQTEKLEKAKEEGSKKKARRRGKKQKKEELLPFESETL